jgi:hypothetical protein
MPPNKLPFIMVAAIAALGLASVGSATSAPDRSRELEIPARVDDDDGGEAPPENPPDNLENTQGMKDFARANAARWRWMTGGAAKLRQLREDLASAPGSVDVGVLNAVKSWLHLTPGELDGDRNPSSAELDALISKFEGNRDKTGVSVTVVPRVCPFTPACATSDIACTAVTNDMIHLQQAWVDASARCQDSVVVHEFFHATGHSHPIPNVRRCRDGHSIMAVEALGLPDCLAGLACELEHGGSSCSAPCG